MIDAGGVADEAAALRVEPGFRALVAASRVVQGEEQHRLPEDAAALAGDDRRGREGDRVVGLSHGAFGSWADRDRAVVGCRSWPAIGAIPRRG